MSDKIISLYYECFPDVITYDDRIREVVEDSAVFVRKDVNGNLIGAAAVKENKIALLCVHPDHRRQGIGTSLFAECEAHVKSKGYNKIQMFGLEPYITPGAPLYEGNRELFEKLGYRHTWGEDECVDMKTDLTFAKGLDIKLGDAVNGLVYRFAAPEDKTAVLDCVNDAHTGFVPYYTSDELYDPNNEEHILIALDGDVVCGTLLVECYDKSLGSVGCTATRHAYRGRGVATTMVKMGTKFLADEGFESAWLGFTYTGIIPMYAKSGYSVFMKYFMGEKSL